MGSKPGAIQRVDDWRSSHWDMLIDVRAPVEFQEDHIPSAINLPVLDDSERSEIGTLYKQVSPFAARVRGASLVSANIAKHLQKELAEKSGSWRPLIYCARGGQRSGSFASVLSEVGWRVGVLKGGYKTFRQKVLHELDQSPPLHRFMVMQGQTGTGKTRLLREMARQGAQVLDLEGLAQHRGSLLGSEPGKSQPTQRYFESSLHLAIQGFEPDRPIFVEAESSKVGQLHIPRTIWSQMMAAERIEVRASSEARIDYLLEDYEHLVANPDLLSPLLEGRFERYGREVVKHWHTLAGAGDWRSLVKEFLDHHYDPAYLRTAKRRTMKPKHIFHLENMREDRIQSTAQEIIETSLNIAAGTNAPALR